MRPAFERRSVANRPTPAGLRDARAVADLFLGVFRRDLLGFFPQCRFESDPDGEPPEIPGAAPAFEIVEDDGPGVGIELFGALYRLTRRDDSGFSPHELRMVRAIAAVCALRYHHLFHAMSTPRLELYRGGSDDHYVAAFVEPACYELGTGRPSRIASTIQTLRTTALSTYENRRVSTGALLLGLDEAPRVTPPDALHYGVELTALKSIHRLCDGKQTLFLVDRDGRLAEIVDIDRWAGDLPEVDGPAAPCARDYAAHARATRAGGHVCLVLSPNQEIKLFAGGVQAFAFAHGRWRILDPATKFAVWESAVDRPGLARALFMAALELAEKRQGGLFVVVDAPGEAVGRLIAPHDVLEDSGSNSGAPPGPLTPGDPLAKRALHYLARGRRAEALDPCVLEALAGIDGALAVDRAGNLIAFGAILRHDAASLPGPISAEGARTTAALVASQFGPVLKVSEDGIVSCFLRGARAWDL